VDKRIAILDTGIDFRHEPTLKYKNSKQITATKSWIQGRPGTVDNDGHGTHAAMLLLKVAPQVELYVAKVFNDQSNVAKAHITPAILWAVNQWEADIISMSFGFKNLRGDRPCSCGECADICRGIEQRKQRQKYKGVSC
jgi:subtilisin family serine protease